jgi:hypothetical protein
MNRVIVITVIVILFLVAGYLIFSNSKKNINSTADEVSLEQSNKSLPAPQIVNRQASFAIFTNGTFRVFTAPMYHNRSTDAYIEAGNPNIVKIKKTGTTWNNFFKTMPFSLTKECLTTGTRETFCSNSNGVLKFFLNGTEDSNALDKEIKDGDQVLVTYGNESEQQIQSQIQKIPVIKFIE